MAMDLSVYQKLNIPTHFNSDAGSPTNTSACQTSGSAATPQDIDGGDPQNPMTPKSSNDNSGGGMLKSLMALIAGLLTGDTAAVSKGLIDCLSQADKGQQSGGGGCGGGGGGGTTPAAANGNGGSTTPAASNGNGGGTTPAAANGNGGGTTPAAANGNSGGTTPAAANGNSGGTTPAAANGSNDKPKKPSDPNAINSPQEAAMALRDSRAVWENVEGKENRKKHLLTREYIRDISENKDGKFSPKEVNAAKYMLDNRVAFDKADKGNDGNKLDDHISKNDLESLIPAGAKPEAGKDNMDIHKAAGILLNDGSVWDNVEGKKNRHKGLITKEYLEHIAANQGGKFSADAVAAAKYTLEHQYVFDKFDKGSDSDKSDDHISKNDLRANL